MFSRLKPEFLYEDVSDDITETDVDVVSDLWSMDGRDVYRGARDPRYTHANVYWLYDEDLQRVGCTEHSTRDHGVFELLWFRDNEFGTLLQEDGWEPTHDIWSTLPERVFNRFVNEEWVTSEKFLEQCLYGDFRIVTPQMLIRMPSVHTCSKCGRKSLSPISTCSMTESPLDFPNKAKIVFVDDDLRVYSPPSDSRVFTLLLPDDDSHPLEQQEQEQVVQSEPQYHSHPPEQQMPETEEPQQSQTEPETQQEPLPPQSHLQTPEQPSNAEEEKPEHM